MMMMFENCSTDDDDTADNLSLLLILQLSYSMLILNVLTAGPRAPVVVPAVRGCTSELIQQPAAKKRKGRKYMTYTAAMDAFILNAVISNKVFAPGNNGSQKDNWAKVTVSFNVRFSKEIETLIEEPPVKQGQLVRHFEDMMSKFKIANGSYKSGEGGGYELVENLLQEISDLKDERVKLKKNKKEEAEKEEAENGMVAHLARDAVMKKRRKGPVVDTGASALDTDSISSSLMSPPSRSGRRRGIESSMVEAMSGHGEVMKEVLSNMNQVSKKSKEEERVVMDREERAKDREERAKDRELRERELVAREKEVAASNEERKAMIAMMMAVVQNIKK